MKKILFCISLFLASTAAARSQIFYELTWGVNYKWAYLHPAGGNNVAKFSIQELRWLSQEVEKAIREYDQR